MSSNIIAVTVINKVILSRYTVTISNDYIASVCKAKEEGKEGDNRFHLHKLLFFLLKFY